MGRILTLAEGGWDYQIKYAVLKNADLMQINGTVKQTRSCDSQCHKAGVPLRSVALRRLKNV
jgi:hypothetical protein